MKREELFTAVGSASPELLERSEHTGKRGSAVRWAQWGVLAACLCFLVFVGSRFLPGGPGPTVVGPPVSGTGTPAPKQTGPPEGDVSPAPTETPPSQAATPVPTERPPVSSALGELPQLEARFSQEGGMGFDGVMYYDIAESEDGNPWTEEEAPTFLPVYRNLAYHGLMMPQVYLDDGELLALAERAAQCLDTRIRSTEYDRIDRAEIPESIVEESGLEGRAWAMDAVMDNGGKVRVYWKGGLWLDFAEPKPLPEGYSFTRSQTSAEEAERALNYLLEEYAPLLERFSWLVDLAEPVTGSSCDRTFAGDMFLRNYLAYSGSGSLEQRILNYQFSKVEFQTTSEGNSLSGLKFEGGLTGAEKLGEYPLIPPDTARALLCAGEYIANVPEEYLADGVVREEDIARVTLVYRTDSMNEFFQPYYLFYVELTEDLGERAEGLRSFGRFYVPAVSGEYLSDFPVWDGRYQ